MARKKARRTADSDPTRFENVIPRAIRAGDADELQLQIRRAKDNGWLTDTTLRHAMRTTCEKDEVEMMRFLLGYANVDNINSTHPKTRETLLMNVKSKAMAQLLLDNGADSKPLDILGRSALMHARSRDITEVFVAAGADLETGNGQARSALMHNLTQEKASTFNARTEIAHYLISNGASLDATDSQGRTILMTAVWRNHVSVVRTLLGCKVNINATDRRGRNVLHHLCEDQDRAKRMRGSLSDDDKSIVDLVIGSKVQINIRDSFEGKTPLHRAVESNSLYTVQGLLKKLHINVSALDGRNKTALHIAAANANIEILKALLQKGADSKAESDGGWTPLHNAAAGQGEGRVGTIKTLLSHGASPAVRLRTGKTPLHLACEAGDVEVVKVLLEQAAVSIIQRDNEGNTPLISAAKLGHSHLVKHLTPLSRSNSISDEASKASKGFLATILDFGPEKKNGNRRENRCMYDLLYDKYQISPEIPDGTSASDLSGGQRFRWIHCPSNNITWCQELLLKRFTEQDGADAEGFKALEKSFNHQHRGPRLHAHYMRPCCHIVPHLHHKEDSKVSEAGSYISEDLADESVTDTLYPPSERPRSRSSASKSKSRSARNRHGRQPSGATLRAGEDDSVLKNDSSVVPSYAMSSARSATNMFFFAPSLHYETNKGRREMQKTINVARTPSENAQPNTQSRSTSADCTKYDPDSADADENLILAHVDSTSCSMNIRRTLDQYLYRTIDTAKYRDHDQVVHRYQRKHLSENENTDGIKMLMVDQLWMWIVGQDLIITSFPQRWQQPRNDPHNVLETIVSDINAPGRGPVSSVYELAMIIATRSFGLYDRGNIGEGETPFLDMFESSIGDAMNQETELFRAFNSASKEASRWLKVLTSPGKADYMYDQPPRAPKLDQDQSAGQDGHHKTSGPRPTLVRTLLDIGDETRLMREIKDIRDELNMLRMILKEQEKLLPELHKTLVAMIRREGGSQKLERHLDKIHESAMPDIFHPLRDIDRMDKQAESSYHSVRDLLDLKQNYAISMQAADTARQGRTLMVFTVVTVIFLPLSFLTAFFALDIRDFPHDPNGNQDLPLSFVAKYIFGIGFVVALLSVLLALAWERLGLYVRHGRRKLWLFLHRKSQEHWGTGQETSDSGGIKKRQTWQSDATTRSSIEQPRETHQRVAFAADVEKGVG